MDKEIIRAELAKMRNHLEDKGIIRPIRKEPKTLEDIEKLAERSEEIKSEDMGF